MQRQTFIDNIKEREYSISATINGNIKGNQRGYHDTIGAVRQLRCPHRHANRHRDNRKGRDGR